MGGNVIQGERLCLSQLLSTLCNIAQHAKKTLKPWRSHHQHFVCPLFNHHDDFDLPLEYTLHPSPMSSPIHQNCHNWLCLCFVPVFVTNSTNVDLQFINHNILFVIRLTSHHSSQFSHNPHYYRNCNNWESITGTSLLWSLSLPLCRNENKNLTRVGGVSRVWLLGNIGTSSKIK